MTFMHEGGLAMWATLILFVAATAASLIRRKQDGNRIAISGAVAVIASGLAGFSTGLYTTLSHLGSLDAADRAEAMSFGLGESVNNTLFAAVLAFGLAVLAIALAPRRELAAA
jgi:hypothetical protein